jgi:hemerythrin
MTALTWTDALALNQPCMDDTHRAFVDALNAANAARGSGLAAV